MGLIGVIIASVVNWFMDSEMLYELGLYAPTDDLTAFGADARELTYKEQRAKEAMEKKSNSAIHHAE